MSTQKSLPCICPSCQSVLAVKSLVCSECQTEVSGRFDLPQLAVLPATDQQFILEFVKSSGSLKDMAQKMGLSYPTVRNLLDDLITRLNPKP